MIAVQHIPGWKLHDCSGCEGHVYVPESHPAKEAAYCHECTMRRAKSALAPKAKEEIMGNDVRSFGALLHGLENGDLLVDLNDKLHELGLKLVKQSESVGKAKGGLTLKVKMAADSGGTVNIDCEIKMSEPKPARGRSVLWLAKDGVLTVENPKQTKLPLREVAGPKAEEARSV